MVNPFGSFRFCLPVLGTLMYFCQDVAGAVQFNVTSQSGGVLTAGQTFRASCDVGGYTAIDLISNLVIHWKSQNGNICIFGTKTKDAPGKYECSNTAEQKISSFVLTIPDVSMEDSGNYTCEVEEKSTSSAMDSSIQLQVKEITSPSGTLETTDTMSSTIGYPGSSTGHPQTFPVPLLVSIATFLVYLHVVLLH